MNSGSRRFGRQPARSVVAAALLTLFASCASPERPTDERTDPGPSVHPMAGWVGRWSGTMRVITPRGERDPVSLDFEIGPRDEGEAWTWKLTYGRRGEGPIVVKDYLLVPDAEVPGRYVIDEQNGILLDARLEDDVLVSWFQLGERMFLARYEQREDWLSVEVQTAGPREADQGERPRRWGMGAFQRAVLIRVDASAE